MMSTNLSLLLKKSLQSTTILRWLCPLTELFLQHPLQLAFRFQRSVISSCWECFNEANSPLLRVSSAKHIFLWLTTPKHYVTRWTEVSDTPILNRRQCTVKSQWVDVFGPSWDFWSDLSLGVATRVLVFGLILFQIFLFIGACFNTTWGFWARVVVSLDSQMTEDPD